MAANGASTAEPSEAEYAKFKSLCNIIFDADPAQKQSEACLLRFMRAFLTADQAFTMLVKCIKWRREFGVESLSDADPDIKMEIDSKKAILLRHRDFNGRPILYISARKHSANDRDIDRLTKFIVYMLELACKKCNEEIIDTLCIVFDLKDFSTNNMDYQFVKNLIWLLSHHYPERLGVCLIINAPVLFYGCWTVIKPWLSPVTTNKVLFVDDVKMRDYIHPDMLPDDVNDNN